mmetsp:Transcript_55555/g.136143  ORF Transcript_55555/g.136143 Transcript_55555/m.136143 type:complete len:325 (-) Transcript_55555:9-983(-)
MLPCVLLIAPEPCCLLRPAASLPSAARRELMWRACTSVSMHSRSTCIRSATPSCASSARARSASSAARSSSATRTRRASTVLLLWPSSPSSASVLPTASALACSLLRTSKLLALSAPSANTELRSPDRASIACASSCTKPSTRVDRSLTARSADTEPVLSRECVRVRASGPEPEGVRAANVLSFSACACAWEAACCIDSAWMRASIDDGTREEPAAEKLSKDGLVLPPSSHQWGSSRLCLAGACPVGSASGLEGDMLHAGGGLLIPKARSQPRARAVLNRGLLLGFGLPGAAQEEPGAQECVSCAVRPMAVWQDWPNACFKQVR